MASDQNDAERTASGIITNANGQRVVAASVRADGSVRKEIKIRPGYTPQEDIATYKNRNAEAWRNRGKSGGVPGAEPVENTPAEKDSAAATKNAKRKEARKRAAAAAAAASATAETEGNEPGKVADAAAQPTATDGTAPAGKDPSPPPADEPADPAAARAKEARKLAKKLRQARELQDKKAHGDALLPEQLDKVIRIHELVRQLARLGFDADGEPRTDGEQRDAGSAASAPVDASAEKAEEPR